MKSYSLTELQEQAKKHFDKLGVQKLYATTDGQFFLLENRARLHAGPKGMVHCIEIKPTSSEVHNEALVKEVEDMAATAPLSIPALKKEIVGKSLEELHQLLTDEIAGGNRKGAVEVLEKAISALV